jgi:hypothetical protein
MRKKLALSCALIHEPRALFLDEPFEGIDAIATREIRELLQQLVTRRGVTVFLTSHVLEVVERLCTQIGIIAQGRLVAQGTLEELTRNADGSSRSLEDFFRTGGRPPRGYAAGLDTDARRSPVKMLRLLVWLRWKLFLRSTTPGSRLGGALLTLLLLAMLAPAWFAGALAAHAAVKRQGAAALPLIYGVCQLAWVAFGLLSGALGRAFDLDKFLRYPVRPRTIFATNVLASLLAPAPVDPARAGRGGDRGGTGGRRRRPRRGRRWRRAAAHRGGAAAGAAGAGRRTAAPG